MLTAFAQHMEMTLHSQFKPHSVVWGLSINKDNLDFEHCAWNQYCFFWSILIDLHIVIIMYKHSVIVRSRIKKE